jgi:DNA-binding LacI/PurR family transcriptional regulator
MTEVAIATLLDQIETGKPPAGRRLLFEPKLVVRASCGPMGEPKSRPIASRHQGL